MLRWRGHFFAARGADRGAAAAGNRRLAWRSASAALEFAIVAPALITFMLFVLELSYDFFVQEALNATMRYTAYQISVGNTQNLTGAATAANFAANYICPGMNNLLECGNVYVNMNVVPTDYYNQTIGPGGVSNAVSAGTGRLAVNNYSVCNAEASTAIIVQLVYTGPTFLGILVPGFSVLQASGSGRTHLTYAALGFVSEPFPTFGSSSLSAC